MLVTAVLAAQYAGTFDVADSTSFSVRASQPPPPATAYVNGKAVPGEIILAADASTAATARLQLRQRQWDYSLGFGGSVSSADLEQGITPAGTLSANAAEIWHDRQVRVGLSESGSYGLVSAAVPYQAQASTMTMMPSQPGMTGQPMQGQTTPMQGQPTATGSTLLFGQPGLLTIGSFDGSGNVSWRPSRTMGIVVQGGYRLAGGLDPPSRLILPEQYGPHAGVSATSIVSKADSVGLTLDGQETTTVGLCTLFAPNLAGECREDIPSADAGLVVRHRTSQTGAVTVVGGVAATVAATPGLNELVIVPMGSVSITDSFEERRSSMYALTASVAPTVDIRTGLPSNRVVLTGSVSDRLTRVSTLRLSAGLTQSLDFPFADPYPLTLYTSTVEVRVMVSRRLTVALAFSAYVQHQVLNAPDQPPAGGPEWTAAEIATVSVTANVPTLHF